MEGRDETSAKRLRALDVRRRVLLGGATALSAGLNALGRSPLLLFVTSAIALAVLASLVGDATEQLGSRMGPCAPALTASPLCLPTEIVAHQTDDGT